MKRQIISVIGVEIVDIDLFYHFINYYNPYVDKFSLVFNYQNKDILDSFYEMVPQNKRNIQFWDKKFDEDTKTKYINELISVDDRVSLIADHDEFIEFNEGFFDCPKNKCNVGKLVQRFNVVNDKVVLSKVERDKSLFDQFKYSSTIDIPDDYISTFRLSAKICYVNNNVIVSNGHHCFEGWKKPRADQIHTRTNVNHFKYDSYFSKVVKNYLELRPKHEEIIKINKLILKASTSSVDSSSL
jgi:hypothetical protein